MLVLVLVPLALGAQEITVAVFDGAAPVSFVNGAGRADGFMPELLHRLLSDLGYEPRFITGITFQEAFQRVASGEIDILPGAVYTAERDDVLDFNDEPFMVAWGQLGVLPRNDFGGLLDLRNRRIGLMRDGQNAAHFIDLMERFDIPFEPVYFSTYLEIARAIQDGTVAAGVFFSTWFHSAEGIVPSSIVFTPTQGFVATAEGNNAALFGAIDARLRALKSDEGSYYYTILNRWFSQDTGATIPRWVYVLGAAVLVGLFISLAFGLLLRKRVLQATKELAESRERYKTIANYAHGWEFWNDPEGKPVFVSPNTVEITGYEASQFLTDPGLVERIILPEDRPIWEAHLAETHTESGERDRNHCMFRIRTATGETRWIEHRCTRVESSDGIYLGRRGSNSDVTERAVQEQALERGIQEKEAMLQEIHHRVKNNLQMVSSLISLQKSGVENSEANAHLEAITMRIEAIAALHSTLYQDETFVAVDMQDYLRTIASRILNMENSNRRITYEIDVANIDLGISKALPCGLIANEALINAYKHAFGDASEGKISIGMHEGPEGTAHLSITDTGMGIPDVVRMQAETNGIGLQLISALADQLGGELKIEGQGGVTIEVVFPID